MVRWTDQDFGAIKAELARSSTVGRALRAYEDRTGKRMSTAKLATGFAARNWGTPKQWLGVRLPMVENSTANGEISRRENPCDPKGKWVSDREWVADPCDRVATCPSGGTTRILVCPDAHHPFVDPLAWSTFLAAARGWRPDILVLIGDFADCLGVGSYFKDPGRRENLKGEIEATAKALAELKALRIPRNIYIFGNHEDRLRRYIWEKAPELYGLVSLPEMFKLDELGWEYVPYKRSIQIGKMTYTHDIGRCGKYTASQSLADYGNNITVGHSHRACVTYLGTAAGEHHVGLNVGTLIDFKSVDYRHIDMANREWQHGFGTVHMTGDGCVWANFVPIVNGRCVVDGQVYSGVQ